MRIFSLDVSLTVWQFIMRGDDTDYKDARDYVEVVKPVGLVYDHIFRPQFS